MLKTFTRLVCVLLLLAVSMNGMAQSKTKSKNKPAADTTKPARHAEDEVIKIGTLPDDEKPPEVEKLEDVKIKTTPPALPPLPDIDTVPPPNDELTKEIKKLLVVTNAFTASKTLMTKLLATQRQNNTGLPDEFYARMLGVIENGQVTGYIENTVIKIYRQKFTLEDIKGVIKFYETPLGKKMATEIVPIMEASSSAGEKVGQYMAIKIIGDLIKEGKWK